MSDDEREALVKRLYHGVRQLRQSADFQVADCIGYGGPLEVHRDYRRRLDSILREVPPDLLERWAQEDREAKAFALEEQARALRRGTTND